MRKLMRVVLVLIAVGAIAGIEIYLQNDAMRECVELGLTPSECSDQHRSVGRAVGLGAVVAVLLIPALVPVIPQSLKRLLDRLHRPILVSPTDSEDKRRLSIASSVAAAGFVVFPVALVLWMAAAPANKSLTWLFGSATVVGGLALVLGVVFTARIIVRTRRTEHDR